MASNRIWRDKKIILDSSALMMVFEFNIDIEEELDRLLGRYHILIPRNVVDEIDFLSQKGRGRKKQLAKTALKLLQRYDIIDVDSNLNADDAVVAAAEEYNGMVVTNDRELRRKLKEKGIPRICLRGKHRLMIE
ncbi:MAG: hypothetical protein DRN12_01990 [Thermoplasmata archaeon]|nr:MAG: hypothetical protein DRN12_01990 [Thermoplasmata archaeon]